MTASDGQRTRDWDAETYHRVSAPQVAFAGPVIERMGLRGDETVLDAGCGSGRVTQMLVERLPRGRVIAVDAAPSMVDLARETLAGRRASVLQAELTSLELSKQVHAVFSSAVFHWIADHDALFTSLHAALLPGGRLVAQCGGEGNIDNLHEVAAEVSAREPFAEYFSGWAEPWNFARPTETERRLLAAGFIQAECWLEPFPVEPPEPLAYLTSVCLGNHLDALPEDMRAGFAEQVLAGCPRPLRLRYVRLNIEARAAS
ncbi:MAG: methyltransferase domain-containing protein [Thermoleophilaceae bacterium]|nr:methyltransferase domain-containing protein [Thermoleophilaceae bacterium]